MKAGYTHILYILDRSGSMGIVADDVQAGLNRFIEEQRKHPGKCTFSLVQFDEWYEEVHRFADVDSVRPFTFRPRGCTALWDSVARAMNETGAVLRHMQEDSRPEKVLVIIHTDGHDNSSQVATKTTVRSLINEQTSKYNWTVTFIGTNIDVASEGQQVGVAYANTMGYENSSSGIARAYSTLCCATNAYRSMDSAASATACNTFFVGTITPEGKADDSNT